MKKAGNALASFCSDVKILQWAKCFLLLAFVYHCWEERRAEQELSLHKRGAIVHLHCHHVTEMKHVTHLHWVSARTSPLLSELSVCWAGCCSTAGGNMVFPSVTQVLPVLCMTGVGGLWCISNLGTCRAILLPGLLWKKSLDSNPHSWHSKGFASYTGTAPS